MPPPEKDFTNLPITDTTQPRQLSEMKEQGVQKHQAVFNISWPMWQSMVDAFEITESTIPERKNEENVAVGARGWYG
jgi:non-structural maintenance of chromosomes element 4